MILSSDMYRYCEEVRPGDTDDTRVKARGVILLTVCVGQSWQGIP